jgi:hypothetical protein
MAIDSRFVLLASGTNLFAMAQSLFPTKRSTIVPIYKGVTAISLGIVNTSLYEKIYNKKTDSFVETLGGYPGYIALYMCNYFYYTI